MVRMKNTVVVHKYPVGVAIKEYLLQKGEGSATDFYHMYKTFKPTTSYSSICKFFYSLKKLGLIRVKRRENRTPIPKTYYYVVPTHKDDPRWNNPQKALYGAKK
jgi:hypothetical protein